MFSEFKQQAPESIRRNSKDMINFSANPLRAGEGEVTIVDSNSELDEVIVEKEQLKSQVFFRVRRESRLGEG